MKKTMKNFIAVLLAIGMIIPIVAIMSSAAITLVWPVPDSRKINQGYHSGCAIDIGDTSAGNAKVVSATSGTVKNVFKCTQQHAGSSMGSNGVKCDGFGTGVVIQGPDGRFYGYAHMKANSIPSNIYVGATVTAGQQIGNIGSTGNSTGNHLHFQITTGTYYNSNSNINPAKETYTYSTTSYTLTYDANGGSGAPSQETGTTNFVISSIKPTRMGYTFLGWSESSSATSASCTSGDIVYNIDKNITLYAVWRKNNLNVYYNVNGGSISSDEYKLSSNVIYNKSDSTKYFQKWTYNNARDNGLINKSTFGIYKDGYTFAGWGTTASGGTIFDPDDTTIVPTDLNSNIKNGDYSITLFAQWKPNTLNVYYNANGGSISSDIYKLNSNIIYNKSDSSKYCHSWTYNFEKPNGLINDSTFGLSKEGYTFAGWGTTSSGGTIFNQDDTSILPTNLNANIRNGDCSLTLYAIWKKIPPTQKPAAPVVSISRTSVAKGNSVTLTWSNVSNVTNYWIEGFKGETRVMGEIDNNMSKTLTLEPGTYSFTVIAINELGETSGNWVEFTVYDSVPNAPKVSVNKKLTPKGSSVKLTWTECDNVTNYWIEGFKGETRVMGEIDNSMSKTLTLEPGTYSFTVMAINELGETSGNWVEFTVYDSAPKAPVLKVSNDLIKKGEKVTLSWNAVNNVTNYWIQGYKDGKTFVAEIDNSKSRTMILDVGYYEFVVKAINELGETNSNWVNFTVYDPQETTYTLTYNANGGSGAPSSQSGSSTYTVSYTTPTRSGYTFLGWSTSSSSSYATYDAGDTITLTSNTTLYAVWEQNYNSGSKSKCGRCGATFYDDEALEAHLANCDGYFNNNNISVTIRNNPGTRTLNYGDTVRIYADAQNLPAGAKIGWYVDDGSTISAKVSDDGTYCDITATGNGTVTLAAKAVDANGNVMTDSNGYQIADVQKINTKTSLWLRIVSFFKNLFDMNRTTVQLFKGLF